MVDAEHGDCNVIDLCRARIDGNGQYNLIKESTEIPTYSRSIIDCGPYQKTLDALKAVLTDVGQPKFLAQQGGTASIPAGFDDAKVQQLQVCYLFRRSLLNGVPQVLNKPSSHTLTRIIVEMVRAVYLGSYVYRPTRYGSHDFRAT